MDLDDWSLVGREYDQVEMEEVHRPTLPETEVGIGRKGAVAASHRDGSVWKWGIHGEYPQNYRVKQDKW